MKKAVLIFVLLLTDVVYSQNLQLHYDLGHSGAIKRDYFTATFEFFKPDAVGSTFMFVDFDFAKDNGGVYMAYGEIVRKFTLHKKSGLSLHLEYDDGTLDFIVPAFLGGISYPIKIGEFTIYTSLLYKAYYKANSPDGQLTLVWNRTLFNSRFLFSGFVDIWSQDKLQASGKDFVFLSEPQLWYLLTNQLKVGSELEISRNFLLPDKKFKFMPTLAVRWDF